MATKERACERRRSYKREGIGGKSWVSHRSKEGMRRKKIRVRLQRSWNGGGERECILSKPKKQGSVGSLDEGKTPRDGSKRNAQKQDS